MEKETENHYITVQNILDVTKGELITGEGKKDSIVENYCIDTRNIAEGDIHLGIKRPKVNGGIYFEEALERGAIGCIIQDIEISEEQKKKYNDKVIIKVDNTLEALAQIAKYKRNLYKNLKVVAVTGSVGKTSTKDIIASVISQKYKTLKTQGNLNNDLGVPLTILRLRDEEVLVIEMGMNHEGEIRRLTNIAKPDICIITNVGTSHIGNLGSRENILKAKLEILEGSKSKIIVINNDNDMLNKWSKGQIKEIQIENEKIYTFGIEQESDLMAVDINTQESGTSFKCIKKATNEEFKIYVPVGGKHFVYNALCATQIGILLKIEPSKIIEGIEKFELTQKRMELEKIKENIILINDAYNASYESMKAALEYIGNEYKEYSKIAILGDMLELGKYSKELHEKVGKEVEKNDIDFLVCAGEYSKYIKEAAQQEGMTEEKIYYTTEESKEKRNAEIIKRVKEKIEKTKNKTVILVKASNSMEFYKIAEELKNKMEG